MDFTSSIIAEFIILDFCIIELSCLRHLRELRAEGNKITSLEGLERLDGLLKLDLQSNELKSIELSTFKWYAIYVSNGFDDKQFLNLFFLFTLAASLMSMQVSP